MSRRIIISPKADGDLADISDYIAQNSVDAASRFLIAVAGALDRLAEMPGIGTLQQFRNPRMAGIRMWPVPGFRKFLIFYRATNETVEIIRVLHGARDIAGLFEQENETD